jgi:DHA1 family inner membrane transport protein
VTKNSPATLPRAPARAPAGCQRPAIYIASALGAAIGGLALALAGATSLTITAAAIGLVAITIAFTIRPAADPQKLRPPSPR